MEKEGGEELNRETTVGHPNKHCPRTVHIVDHTEVDVVAAAVGGGEEVWEHQIFLESYKFGSFHLLPIAP